MKQIMIKKITKTLAVLLMIKSLGSFAQPILTANGINPVVGDVFSYNTTNYVNPGAAGPNQTWNLTTMTVQSVSQTTAVSSSSTPYAATYTNSNICFLVPGQYNYYLTSNSVYQFIGSYAGSAPALVFNPPRDILHYPFVYNNSYTTNYQSTSSGPNPTTVSGTITLSYDGYGTIILPNGMYNNAIRIHTHDLYTQAHGTVIFDSGVEDSYDWYINGNHSPVATVRSLTTTAFGSYTSGSYLNIIITSTGNDNFDSSFLSFFPSPAKEVLNMKCGYDNEISKAELIGIDGKVLITDIIDPGSKEINMDVRAIAKGLYVVKVYFLDGKILINKVVVE